MGLFDNLTYAFSGSAPAGDPGSPQALETRRKIALAMIGRERKGYPKNVGEGLTAIGDALGERSQLAQLEAQQAAFDKWGEEHKPPAASSLMTNPPPAATGPRADASPQMPPIAPTQADASAAPAAAAAAPASWLSGAVADNADYQPADALPPVQDAGGAAPIASADTGTVSDAPPMGAPTGQPNPAAVRASIAQLMQARQGGPQPNPMLAGQQPASAPSAISPDPAYLGSPLEQNPPRTLPGVQVAGPAGAAPDIPEINRVTPPVTMPKPGPVQQPPNAPYNKLELQGADMEQWGYQRGDERYIKQGQEMQRIGKEQRDRDNADLQKKYEMDRQLESQRVIEQQRAEQGKGVAQQQLIEQTAKAAEATRANRFGGGAAYQQFLADVSKKYDATQQLANTLPTLQQAKQALAQSYTGKGAEIKLDANKMLRTLGVPGDYTPAVATELLQSRMKAIAGGMIKSTVGSQNISDADRDFVEAAYAGRINMEPESLRRLLNIAEDTTIRSINQHNDRLIGVSKHPDDRAIREQYQVPMLYGDPAVNYLKAHPDTADAFNRKFGKGHAESVLRGTPYGQ